jgi:hypothetical protein
VEPVVLREGEGLALRQLVAAGVAHALDVCLEVRVVGTGNSYFFHIETGGAIVNRALMSLFNGVGSGVVLEVRDLCALDPGEVSQPVLRLVRTEGYQGDIPPTLGTAVALDSQSTLNANVQLIMGPFVSRLPGSQQGVPYEWFRTHGTGGFSVANQQQAGSLRAQTRASAPTGPDVVSPPVRTNYLWRCRQGQCGIILRRSEGLSVLVGGSGVINTSIFNFYAVRFLFTYTPKAVLNPLRGTVVSAA